jgi:ABC-2 type transport system permease protein
MRQFIWLVRRELWESRSAWLVPAVTALVISVVALLGLFYGVSGSFSADFAAHVKVQSTAIDGVVMGLLIGIAALFLVILQIVQYAYLVDTLYSERKDRSILFWKSLPVGDAATVLSKLAFALVVMPALAAVALWLTQVILALAVSVKLMSVPGIAAALWTPSTWAHVEGFGLYELLAVELWALPVMAWVLLVSAVAPRSPALVALLIPAAIALVEKLLLGTHAFITVFVSRLGFPEHAGSVTAIKFDEQTGEFGPADVAGRISGESLLHIDVAGFLSNPNLWWGVLVGIVLIATTIEVRRRRDPSA